LTIGHYELYGRFFHNSKQLKDMFKANNSMKLHFYFIFLRSLTKIKHIRYISFLEKENSTKNHQHRTSNDIVFRRTFSFCLLEVENIGVKNLFVVLFIRFVKVRFELFGAVALRYEGYENVYVFCRIKVRL